MIRSMTGFGSASGQFGERALSVEMKSVNNRFREVVTRMPKLCAPLEESVKKLVAARIERGRVDLWVQIDEREARKKAIKIDFEFAREIHSLLNELRGHLDIKDPVSLTHLLDLGVVGQEEEDPDLDELWAALKPSLETAPEGLVIMREAEGLNLTADIENRLGRLAASNRKIEELSSRAPDVLLEKLQNRLAELGAGVKVDQSRLAQEVAPLADRVDITEEVVRLGIHLARFGAFIAGTESSRWRPDFLLQEMGREVNTLGS